MSEDDVIPKLRDEARRQREEDARWEAVARGEASPEELAELQRRAEGDPEIAAMLAACRPLDEDAEARVLARASAEVGAQTGAKGDSTKATSSDAAKVIPLAAARPAAPRAHGETWRKLGAWIGPVALAAAVVLYVVAGSRGGEGELPLYAVTAQGEQTMRGPAAAPSARLVLGKSRDARFELLARPQTSSPVKVVAYVFAVGDGEPSPVDAKVEISDAGAVRITGSARTLEGAREVRVVVGAPEAIGKFGDALAKAQSGRGDDRVRVLVVAVDREP